MQTDHGKRRFSLFIPGLGIIRYGNCEILSDDWRNVVCEQGEYYLLHLSPTSKEEVGRYHLNPMTLIASGYYDEEISSTGGFIPVKDFQW